MASLVYTAYANEFPNILTAASLVTKYPRTLSLKFLFGHLFAYTCLGLHLELEVQYPNADGYHCLFLYFHA
jgi:hypothetical protein